MSNNDPKNTAERQATFREKKKSKGYSELSVWVTNDTLKKINLIADQTDISLGEVVDKLVGQSEED